MTLAMSTDMSVPASHHPIITGILLGLAVGITTICCIGMASMRDAYQRIHFSTVVVSFSTTLVIVAVWVEESDPQARIKVVLIGGLLFVMNAVLNHATTKAIRIKERLHWDVQPGEGIPIVGRDPPAGGEQRK